MLTDDQAARCSPAGWRPVPRSRPGAWKPAWAVLALLAAAAGLDALVIPWHSFDADHWFVPWLDQMLAEHPWTALGTPMQVQTDGASGYANYNPATLYLFALGCLLSPWLDAFHIVKAVAVAGTLACSASLYVLLRHFVPAGRAAVAAALVSVLPTVVLNGAAWGQTDAIYSGLMVLSVAAAVRHRWPLMLLAFGGALAFKLPAIFLAPVLLHVVIAHRVPLRLLPLAPLAYAASIVPAWLAGRSARDLAGVYLDQAATYHWLSMKAPNPWSVIQYLGLVPYEQGVAAGTAAALLAGLGIAGLATGRRLDGAGLLLLAVAAVTLLPFLLPKMHDRYFFPADVLSFAYAAARPTRRSITTAACVQLGSLAACSSILFGLRAGPILGCAAMTAAILLIAWQLADADRVERLTRRRNVRQALDSV